MLGFSKFGGRKAPASSAKDAKNKTSNRQTAPAAEAVSSAKPATPASADSAAAELAEALPPSIGGLVHDQFERNMGELQKRYTEARDRTVEIDSVIRQYLQQQ